MQSQGATVGVFLVVLLALKFFQEVIGIRGIFMFIVAGVFAWLFREYWADFMRNLDGFFSALGLVRMK